MLSHSYRCCPLCLLVPYTGVTDIPRIPVVTSAWLPSQIHRGTDAAEAQDLAALMSFNKNATRAHEVQTCRGSLQNM